METTIKKVYIELTAQYYCLERYCQCSGIICVKKNNPCEFSLILKTPNYDKTSTMDRHFTMLCVNYIYVPVQYIQVLINKLSAMFSIYSQSPVLEQDVSHLFVASCKSGVLEVWFFYQASKFLVSRMPC